MSGGGILGGGYDKGKGSGWIISGGAVGWGALIFFPV